MLIRILDELQYPPEHLCLEVTERCRLLDIELLKNVLSSLKARGILIALDDFGTGFSSVGIVKELPFDIIKIDRSFVQKIEEDEVERELIKNFSMLASLFGAKVCVEGIETEGMKDILQRFHVESFQGYYYAKPLMIEDFFDWNNKR
jgi:EAL domain-containing protein (putative c-di-GMP-specific phosphodiesterase class I)